jgi:uncharacterized protein
MPAHANGYYPGQAAIEAYGDGGFRFAGMSHRGSVLALPSGIHAWTAAACAQLSPQDFERAIAEADRIEVLLLGTGATQHEPSVLIRAALEAAGIGLEAMSTGAAARTYNVLLAERRRIAAALIAVA